MNKHIQAMDSTPQIPEAVTYLCVVEVVINLSDMRSIEGRPIILIQFNFKQYL